MRARLAPSPALPRAVWPTRHTSTSPMPPQPSHTHTAALRCCVALLLVVVLDAARNKARQLALACSQLASQGLLPCSLTPPQRVRHAARLLLPALLWLGNGEAARVARTSHTSTHTLCSCLWFVQTNQLIKKNQFHEHICI